MSHVLRNFSKARIEREGVGLDFFGPEGTSLDGSALDPARKWITDEEVERNNLFVENLNIFEGNHLREDGGPFRHPYDANKTDDEGIDYLVLNLLKHISDTFASHVMGKEFSINSDEEKVNDAVKDVTCFGDLIEDAVTMSSVFGWVGLQPSITKDFEGNDKMQIMIIQPMQLRVQWFPARDEIERIDKFTLYEDPTDDTPEGIFIPIDARTGRGLVSGHKKEILLIESHFPGMVATRLFKIKGQHIIEELPLEWFTTNIDASVELEPLIRTGLPGFLISILPSNKLGRKHTSDYTKSAKKLQKQLNNRMTQIARILDIHSNPKMAMPRGMAKQDPETGIWSFDLQGKDLIFYDPESGEVLPQYLTWDGQLIAAQNQMMTVIQAILTETKMAPNLLSFLDIIGSTSADTASKMRLQMQQTLKQIEKRRCFLLVVLLEVLPNGFRLLGMTKDESKDFEVFFPDPVPVDRQFFVEEMVRRKDNMLISSKTAIERLDGLTEEQAATEYEQAVEEADREGRGGFGGFGGPNIPDDDLKMKRDDPENPDDPDDPDDPDATTSHNVDE